MSNAKSSAKRFTWRSAGLAALVLFALVLLLEGIFSFAHMVATVSRHAQSVPADHRHTHRDAELGWAADAGTYVRDAYGPWRALSTDERGLRIAGGTVESGGPGERRQIACVGGSEVFGVGVADDETWCRRLGLADADFHTVNLGQPGYGAGQSFLHYRRLSDAPHDVALFVVTDETLELLAAPRHEGFPKPVFETGPDGLIVLNTPVSRTPYLWPWATVNRGLFQRSHLLDLLIPDRPEPGLADAGSSAFVFIDHMLAEIRASLEEREGKLVLVYLPGFAAQAASPGDWQLFLRNETRLREMDFIDLTSAYAAMPATLQREMAYPGGFLSPFAHYWIASALADALAEIDGIEDFDGDGPRPWLARYYHGEDYVELAGTERHPLLSADWSRGAPLPALSPDRFSAVFDSCLPLEKAGRVRVMLEADGHAQLSLNGQSVLDTGHDEGLQQRVNTVALPAGMNHIRVRYVETGGAASVRLVAEFDGRRVAVPGGDRLVPPVTQGRDVRCPASRG